MTASAVELPGHLYLAALEEQLLLGAYRRLSGTSVGDLCPPAATMATRNDLIALAHKHLCDVAALDSAITGQVIVDLPRPIGAMDDAAPPAEQLAWHTLSEAKGSVWAAVRSVVQLLRWDKDPRAFANGQSFTLGLFAKGGLRGLTRATPHHANVCRLLNHMVSEVLPLHEWTSLTLTLDDVCEPHLDRGNREGRSLLVGLSNHDQGGIWIANQDGDCFAEVGDTIYAGEVFQTSAKAVTFDAKRPHGHGERSKQLRLTTVQHPGAAVGLLGDCIYTAALPVVDLWEFSIRFGVIAELRNQTWLGGGDDKLWSRPLCCDYPGIAGSTLDGDRGEGQIDCAMLFGNVAEQSVESVSDAVHSSTQMIRGDSSSVCDLNQMD
ncbi:unnamed protein product [Symbiodinium sp. CCMP2592]|nr:unnamed protein product [Symbiodinium sp. CCMP2592]